MSTFALKIDGIDLPSPSSYSFTEADLVENSTRNAKGFASWDMVRPNLGNLSLTWENADAPKLRSITAALRGKKQFACTFFNPYTGQTETRSFYAGDRANELVRYVSALQYWSTLTVPFVEV